MPHTSSAKKSLRQTMRRRLHNRTIKKDIKVQLKKFLAAVQEGTLEQARQEYNIAAMHLDRAGAKRVIHPNLAARKKSQLARMLRTKQAGGQPAKA
jgi:small subunit ribosomal protein S20